MTIENVQIRKNVQRLIAQKTFPPLERITVADDSLSSRELIAEKEKKWQQAVGQIGQIEAKDPHRLKIDSQIKNTVIGLNANGMSTTMSCEGHLNHGSGSPYILITTKKAQQLDREANMAYIQQDPRYEQLKELSRTFNTSLLTHLQEHLDDFYQSRLTTPQTQLVAELTHDRIILRNRGSHVQKTASQQERETNLKNFQREMKAFGLFLKQKFFLN
jgi:hypothetical protein